MQFIVIKDQLISFLWAILLGSFFALCYDGVRVVRMLVLCTDGVKIKFSEKIPVRNFGAVAGTRLQMLITNIFDLLFSLFVSASFCIFLFSANNGRFRWYLLFGCVVGFAAYRLSLGRLTYLLIGYVAGGVHTLLGFALYLVSAPFLLAARGIKRAFEPVCAALLRRKMIRKTEKIKRSLAQTVRLGRRSL